MERYIIHMSLYMYNKQRLFVLWYISKVFLLFPDPRVLRVLPLQRLRDLLPQRESTAQRGGGGRAARDLRGIPVLVRVRLR